MKTTYYRTSTALEELTEDIWSSVPKLPLQIYALLPRGSRWIPVIDPMSLPTFGAAARFARALSIVNPDAEFAIYQQTPSEEWLPLADIFQKLFRRVEMTIELPGGIQVTGGPPSPPPRAILGEQTGELIAHVEVG